MNKLTLNNILFSALFLFGIGNAMADDDYLKPFILASKGAGTVAEKTEQAKAALTAAGFTVVGNYSPYTDASILVVTNDELKKNAADSEHGGFGAIQRVSITKIKDEVQVSYTNPVYMSHVYRMKSDLIGVVAGLANALGRVEEFGAKSMTAKQARNITIW